MKISVTSTWLQQRIWLWLFIMSIFFIHLFFKGDWLIYDMHAIGDGEYWRLISSSLSHKNWSHLTLNVTAFLALLFLFPQDFIGVRWLALFFMIVFISNLIIMAIYTNTVTHSGLSGALHGLIYILSLRNIASIAGKLLLLLLFIKLTIEQFFPELLISGKIIDEEVFYDSHLIGAIAAVWVQILVRMANKRSKKN